MDIVLATNTENPFLALQRLERYDDGSGFGCVLSVRSDWLAASCPFTFEASSMRDFIAALRALDRSLTGEAVLKPMWEEQYVRVAAGSFGRIVVSGELIDLAGEAQSVRFSFTTDQTCLAPLIADLKVAAET